jgi:hypothetical protein
MLRWLTIPTAKSLLIWVSGVAATIIGSWISSKFRVYDDSRKAHLDDIKQKVLIPLRDALQEHYGPLVTNRAHVVFDKWGVRQRKENASVTEYPNEDGPVLHKAAPNILASADALFVDAKQRHFRRLVKQIEDFLSAWDAYANECNAWVLRLSDEILSESRLPQFPVVRFESPYVMHFRFAVFIYRRLFRSHDFVLYKREPSNWVRGTPSSQWSIDGFEGTSAQGTEEQIDALLSFLDSLLAREKDTASRLLEKSSTLEKQLALVTAQLTYAIAVRRLHKRCDLVSFF